MAAKFQNKDCIGVVGLGRMGRCLVQGLSGDSKEHGTLVFFTTKHEETAKRAAVELGVKPCSSNSELVRQCHTVVLGVKPQNVREVLAEIKRSVTKEHTIISIVASITTEEIESSLGKGIPVVRAMPNTPAFVKEGITAICMGRHAAEKDWDRASRIFAPVGKLVRVDEKHMNAVTGLSGCGPAYFYVILEAFTDAGIKVGLPRELASQLASQTMLGAARMLQETGKHPAALKDEVTTPAGCTIDGLMELEEGKIRIGLIKAVVQATRRAEALAKPADGNIRKV